MAGSLLQSGGRRRDANIVAMLSLYLLLLAFFILLNTLSKLEEDRTKVVLESVNEAFNGRIQSIASVKPYSAALGPLQDAASLMADLSRLFDQTLPAVRAEVAADSPVLRLELEAAALFRSGAVDLQAGRGLLLTRLSEALLSDRNSRLFFEMELLHGVPERGIRTVADAGDRSLEVRRMGVLVSELIARDLPAERLSVGLVPGRPGVLQFVVRIFQDAPPPVDFADQVE